jgi:general secretion pathway protein F
LSGLLLAVRARVLEGHTLATALGDFPQVFPELYRATVAAGEQSGHLDVVFERLADYTEARQQMRQKVGLALFYPLAADRRRHPDRRWLADLCGAAGGAGVRQPQSAVAAADPRSDCPQRFSAPVRLAGYWRWRGRGGAGCYALRRIGFRRRVHQALLRLPLLARWHGGQHCPVCPHLQHPDGQRRAGAGGVADFRAGD